MDEIGSIWSYQESIDELKHRLLRTTMELESTRINAKEEMRKNEENVKRLLQFLKVAWQERDEARNHLQRLLQKVMHSSPTDIYTDFPYLQPESLQMKPCKTNSSITDSDSPSVDSIFDATSSPDQSNKKMADSTNTILPHQPFVQEYNGPTSSGIIAPGNEPMVEIDQASSEIDNLVKGKPLPAKGRLLQAVMEAGPLLHTLLVSGPLPRWRNPPPVQPLQVLPFSIKSGVPEKTNQKAFADTSLLNPSFIEVSNGVSEIHSTSMLNFTSGSASCLNNGSLLSTGVNIDFVHNQRFQ